MLKFLFPKRKQPNLAYADDIASFLGDSPPAFTPKKQAQPATPSGNTAAAGNHPHANPKTQVGRWNTRTNERTNEPKKERKSEPSALRTALIRAGVSNELVLDVMDSVKREEFLPDPLKPLATQNFALPIDFDQTLSKPEHVGIMTQALLPERGRPHNEKLLDQRARARVLEIGTGSGYHAYILSKLFQRVFSIERHPRLYEMAKERLSKLGALSITLRCADGYDGWEEQAPFDRILFTAFSAREVPPKLIAQLATNGILVAPIADKNGAQQLFAYYKNADHSLARRVLAPVSFVPLVRGVAAKPASR